MAAKTTAVLKTAVRREMAVKICSDAAVAAAAGREATTTAKEEDAAAVVKQGRLSEEDTC
uniref:Uncharacterized protein n=1 Tax=Musa acuminata subsp. malaccensis TaxID=214687 RepID=A0A804K6I0_MUSAM